MSVPERTFALTGSQVFILEAFILVTCLKWLDDACGGVSVAGGSREAVRTRMMGGGTRVGPHQEAWWIA